MRTVTPIALADLPAPVQDATSWLRVGDEVEVETGRRVHRARVTRIELVEPGEKYGLPVPAAPWALVRECGATVDLDDGSWAYGDRLTPLAEDPDTSGR